MSADLRHAIRVLLQAKGWTAVVLVSLALGIGANTALFGGVNALLLQDVHVEDPGRLVRLRWAGENNMGTHYFGYGHHADTAAGEEVSATFSRPVYEQLRDANRTLSGIFAFAPALWQLSLAVDGDAEVASGYLVSGSYFEVLGVHPWIGRLIEPEDDQASASPVIAISHGLWTRRFGRDPGVVGRAASVNGSPATIAGVLPAGYRGVLSPGGEPTDVYLPLALHARLGGEAERLLSPTAWWLQVMGRLSPGATHDQVRGNLAGVFQAAARAEMSAHLEGLTAEERARSVNRERTKVPRLLVDSGRRGLYDPGPDSLRDSWIFGVVVALLLLIVCANIANLLLARATAREREIAVRRAVGATRGRIVRQLLTEGIVLSILGGGLGLLVAHSARGLLPFGGTAPFDWRVFGFAATLSVTAGLLAGLAPAFRASRVSLLSSLGQGGRSLSRSRSLLSRVLLAGQVGVSLALLVGAGLFLKSLENLRAVDVGFDPERILLFRLDPALAGYDGAEATSIYDRVTESVRGIPGVRSVSSSQAAFLSGWIWGGTVHLDGSETSAELSSRMMSVSPGFFETMGIPVLAGRTFGAVDGEDAPQVVLVNEAAVREWFHGENPVGRRLGFSPESRSEAEVVGVVGDVKYSNVRTAAPPTLYRPQAQSQKGARTFEVRTGGPPQAVTPAVREAVRRVDPTLPLMDVSTQARTIDERFRQERFFARAYSLFGGLAALLAAVGLFGLASYDVRQRTREIGVRMALGAESRDVVRMVLRESLTLVVLGVALGVAASLAAGRLVASLLFGVQPWDGVTITQAVVLMVTIATVAVLLPARRACGVEPLLALRSE